MDWRVVQARANGTAGADVVLRTLSNTLMTEQQDLAKVVDNVNANS